ncbi:MAG: glycosyltransferase [Phycisphaerae bacterium]|nr:glycosyltransferase [Phycisphaerae bacterium]
MRIRVLILITDLKTGGAPLHVHRLVTSLDRTAFDVRVACLAPPGDVSPMLQEAGIPTFACGAAGPWDARALCRLRRLIRRQKPDILHAFLFHANVAASVIGPLAGVPIHRIITEIHTVEIERNWHLTLGGMLCRRCRCVVGISPSVVEHLHRRASIPRSRLRIIPGGVNVDRFANAVPVDRASIGLPLEAKLLIWTGRLDPVKGLDDLVKATTMLNDAGVHLALAGQGQYEATIRRCIEEAGLGERIHLLGRRDDVPRLLAAANVFVFPSRTEGLPTALLEAMAAGLPIVTTDVPGCRDLIINEQTGLLVPPQSPQRLAEAIRRVLDDVDLAKRLGREAARHVAERYSFRNTVEQVTDLYRQCMAPLSRQR